MCQTDHNAWHKFFATEVVIKMFNASPPKQNVQTIVLCEEHYLYENLIVSVKYLPH